MVHSQYKISRIRAFYMRKVKFTQSTIHEKLSFILDEFPRMDVRFVTVSIHLHLLKNIAPPPFHKVFNLNL